MSYAAAGVDIEAGDRAVELMKSRVAVATRPEVLGGLGGFAGLFELDLAKYRAPVLASSTDGVGTKIAVAQAMGVHDTIGIDLVAMVVDDLVVCGAEPLFLQDYIACGAVDPERIAAIVGGIAEGCRQAGCALVGGETAEHPGLMEPDHYDVAATGVGVVEKGAVLGPDRVQAGDVVIAMGSSGLHSNGFSLVRHVLLRGAGLDLHAPAQGLGDRPLGEVLLTPTRIYSLDCLALIDAVDVHAFSHITGGGLASNFARVMPAHLSATLDRATWTPQPVFELIRRLGDVSQDEMDRTFNLGVGMVVVIPESHCDAALSVLSERGVPAWRLGVVGMGDGSVTMLGEHPA